MDNTELLMGFEKMILETDEPNPGILLTITKSEIIPEVGYRVRFLPETKEKHLKICRPHRMETTTTRVERGGN